MSDMVEVRTMDLSELSHQLGRFVTHNRSNRELRARYAAAMASDLKASIDKLRERGELPNDLQAQVNSLRLAELEQERSRLRQELGRLDSEELRINRGQTS